MTLIPSGDEQEIGAELVEAVDLSDGCGSKFSLVVVHSGFEGAPLFCYLLENGELGLKLETEQGSRCWSASAA